MRPMPIQEARKRYKRLGRVTRWTTRLVSETGRELVSQMMQNARCILLPFFFNKNSGWIISYVKSLVCSLKS